MPRDQTEVAGDSEKVADEAERSPRIGILVVAYNAVSTLAGVLDRIPPDFRAKVSKVLVCDDFSQDSTYLVGLGYSAINTDLPISVIRHSRNLGYGGNQKAGYQLAIDNDLDIVVLLHGDGQYAPERIADLVGPLERNEYDAVFGSRMMPKGGARKGGMPLYKFVGNRILTRFQNTVMDMNLSEFHSGYRAYRVDALKSIPFQANSDGFNFDTQIIIQLHDSGKRILEVPIPTYYGDEISRVNGIKYAKDVVVDVLRYRLQKRGFASGELSTVGPWYEIKPNFHSSHRTILQQLRRLPPSRILDLGCSAGYLGEIARTYGHHVTGVDAFEAPGVHDRLDRFVAANLDEGIPEAAGSGYDVVVAADVLEHLKDPEGMLKAIHHLLNPGGFVLASVPNFGHWYSRGRTALGLFDYDQRGILDKGHLRFFTRRSFLRMATAASYTVEQSSAVGLPLEVLAERNGWGVEATRRIDKALTTVRPTLFAYQFVFRLRPRHSSLVET
jgi:glycosyltransferase involved in cell wall biosynthesis